ncbi:pentapeptide repeat-containing protein [Sutcliffiella cohnii]|uniref:pentapeptide repeat-containing protein n=1 Tax=Sutcliffiella cohnii TaxID=33932 RepID=UPI002E1B37C3|nr:pentapeptide repeat-containing protein [Sutcliffiella cohnii]
MEKIKIQNEAKQLEAKQANIGGSSFFEVFAEGMNITCATLEGTTFHDVNLSKVTITDANLSDLEINGAQLGGAYIHHIGLPPEGHENFVPGAKQRPLTFEHCELEGSRISNCNLTNVEINDCELTGLRINGILVEDLLASYKRL